MLYQNSKSNIILTIRHILLFLIFSATSCASQEIKQQQSHIDTLKLFDPKPEPTSAQEVEMFKNCLVLFYPNYTIVTGGKKQSFDDLNDLTIFLRKNSSSIRQTKFFLISDSSTQFSKIVSVIDILGTAKIDNYRVINYQEYFAPPEPVQIQAPTSATTAFDESDSTYFKITILKEALEVNLLNQITKLNTAGDLDSFIANHKADINPDKIIIISSSDLPYNKFRPVIDVLKKHEYHKYNLAAK